MPLLQPQEPFLETFAAYLNHNVPDCGFTWSMGYTELFYQILYPAAMSLCWNENHDPDRRFPRETDRWHFHRKLQISRLHNLLCTYSFHCHRSNTPLAYKLRNCTCLSGCFSGKQIRQSRRCRHPRFCPFCLFIERAVPLYMELIRTFGKIPDPSLRLYHLRFRTREKPDSVTGIRLAVNRLTEIRNIIQDCGVSRNSVRRWSGVSLLGSGTYRLRASLDLLFVADKKLLPKFDALAKRFPENRCSLFYCVYGTKTNFRQRLGSFLQYPVWYLTTPFAELEDYLQTDFFRTRLSHF